MPRDRGRVTPTKTQVAVTREVVRWYLRHYFRTPGDLGDLAMFCDPARVGAFAVDPQAIAVGDGAALFRLLVTMAMFQRRQDRQIMRILQSIPARAANELTSARRLLRLAHDSACDLATSPTALHDDCDLGKADGAGVCDARPEVACHLKAHTVLLKRYGDFGKMPTSAALVTPDLAQLYTQTVRAVKSPALRAQRLEAALCGIWRVNVKIANMFLSAVANADFAPGAPWTAVASSHFVVVDSNVDLFLAAIRYRGAASYAARRTFLQQLARRINLRTLDRRLPPFNPRLVQQAAYMFMSATNRRWSARDCLVDAPRSCARCPRPLATRCPVGQDRAQSVALG